MFAIEELLSLFVCFIPNDLNVYDQEELQGFYLMILIICEKGQLREIFLI